LKKLLLINDFEKGGGAEQVFLQTQELLSDKFIIKTFVGSDKHRKPDNILSYIYSVKNQTSSFSRIYSIKNYKRLLDVLLNFKPDIVHLHNYYSFLSPSILNAVRTYRKLGNRLRVIFTAHDYHLLCPYSSFMHYSMVSNKILRLDDLPDVFQIFFYKWDERGFPFSFVKKLQWIYAYMLNGFDREINYIITPSEFLANLFRKKYGYILVSTIRNPFLNMDLVNAVKPSSKSKNDKILKMVFMGRLSPEKGLVEFIEAIKDINSFSFVFKIIGEGPQKNVIQKEIEKYGLQDKIILTGKMEHQLLLKEIRCNDALVLPSIWYENAPLSLVEGAFMNLRLITAGYGGMKEIAELCGGAYLMNPQDTNSVKDALMSCYADTVSGAPLKDRNIERLRSVFSAKSYINKLIDVYNYNYYGVKWMV